MDQTPAIYVEELEPRTTDPYGIRERLWVFFVSWVGFHVYFVTLLPVFHWLPYWEEETSGYAFLAIVATFVLFLSLLVLVIAKTTFLYPFIDQGVLVALWFFLCLLAVPYTGGKWIQWWRISNAPLIVFNASNPPNRWLPTAVYQVDGLIQNKDSAWEQFVRRSKRNPRSNHTYEYRVRYWMSPLVSSTNSEIEFDFFMVNTEGRDSVESYSPTLVASIETKPRHLHVYDTMAQAIIALRQGDLAKPKVYFHFFERSKRLHDSWNRSILAYCLLSTVWLLMCIILFRRNESLRIHPRTETGIV